MMSEMIFYDSDPLILGPLSNRTEEEQNDRGTNLGSPKFINFVKIDLRLRVSKFVPINVPK